MGQGEHVPAFPGIAARRVDRSRSSVGVWKYAELCVATVTVFHVLFRPPVVHTLIHESCVVIQKRTRWVSHACGPKAVFCIFGERTWTCYLVFGSPPLFWKIRPKRTANSSQHDGSCRTYCPVSTAAEGPNLSRDFVQEVKRQQVGGNAQYTSVGGTNS